jgi:hypothetical protein
MDRLILMLLAGRAILLRSPELVTPIERPDVQRSCADAPPQSSSDNATRSRWEHAEVTAGRSGFDDRD